MKTAQLPCILLCAEEPRFAEELAHYLDNLACQVVRHSLSDPEYPDPALFQLVLIEGREPANGALALCQRLRGRLTQAFVPILLVMADASPGTRQAGMEAGADTCLLRPLEQVEFLAQVKAFLRMKDLHDRLFEKKTEVQHLNRRLLHTYQQMDEELALARRIQLSFLPQALPEVPGTRFAVHFALSGRVGGDFYDVFRLDETHVGFYVADAMGHGVPASLLTIFIKKGIKPKEIFGPRYRLVPPNEVLQRLNRELVEQALSDQPFITMAYGQFDQRTRTLGFARAGHPHPVFVPAQGPLCLWEAEGALLGIFDTIFPLKTYQLQPGDKTLFYTDGMDSASLDGYAPGPQSLLACAERHRALPIQELVPQLVRDLFGKETPSDDLTLLGMEVSGEW